LQENSVTYDLFPLWGLTDAELNDITDSLADLRS
jgi:hypothetical protein